MQVNALSELNPSEAIVHSLPLPLPQQLARPCRCSQQLSTGRRGSPPFARSGSRNLTRERRKEKKKSSDSPVAAQGSTAHGRLDSSLGTSSPESPGSDAPLVPVLAHPKRPSDRRRSLPVRLSKHLIGRGNRIRIAWIKSGDCCDGAIVRVPPPRRAATGLGCRGGDHFESFARLNAPLVSSSSPLAQQPDRSTTTRPTGALNGQQQPAGRRSATSLSRMAWQSSFLRTPSS